MKKMKKDLVDLLNIYAPSRLETQVRNYLKPKLHNLMDKVVIDHYGNLLAEKKYGNGIGAVVLLSAHMDTVTNIKENKEVIEEDGVFKAWLPNGEQTVLGADDRAGITVILSVLRNIPKSFNGTIKVAFSREEEVGCIGASNISESFYDDVDLAIVCDRKGDRDIVVGCGMAFCSDKVGEFMEDVSELIGLNYKCIEGGISDAVVFSENGINSINISVGYENEHKNNEMLKFSTLIDSTKLILQALAVINNFYYNFGEVPSINHWLDYQQHEVEEDEIELEEDENESELIERINELYINILIGNKGEVANG